MPQDAFTLKYLCDELNELFGGGKINRIIQPDNDQIILTIYNGKGTNKLNISVNPANPRIGVLSEEKDSPLTAPNFCMLLRKHLLSATIKSIKLVGFDRIVKIELLPTNEYFDDPQKDLYVELMGRYSNIILCENGKILGANRGINVFDNGVRPLFVGKEYVFPPVGQKKLPSDESLIEYYDNFNGDNLPDYFALGVQGVALSTAKELCSQFFDAFPSFDKSSFSKDFHRFVNSFLYDSKVMPCVVIKEGVPIDFSVFPYKLEACEQLFFDRLYIAEDYYFTNKNAIKNFSLIKDKLKNLVNSVIKKHKKKMSVLITKQKEANDAEINRIKGELILANIYKIKQGQDKVELNNYYDDSMMEVDLNVNLSPSKNAEAYYKKYNKQKRTLEVITPQISGIETELNYLNSVLDEIQLCETENDLELIKQELLDAQLIKEQNRSSKKKDKILSHREYFFNGCKIKVGRNNTENDRLTFGAKPNDVWVHVKDRHSSHVIIEPIDNEISDKVIEIAGEICAYYSQCRFDGKAEIVYTLRRNVKKPSKSKPGFCVYENFKSKTVIPNKRTEFLKNT